MRRGTRRMDEKVMRFERVAGIHHCHTPLPLPLVPLRVHNRHHNIQLQNHRQCTSPTGNKALPGFDGRRRLGREGFLGPLFGPEGRTYWTVECGMCFFRVPVKPSFPSVTPAMARERRERRVGSTNNWACVIEMGAYPPLYGTANVSFHPQNS